MEYNNLSNLTPAHKSTLSSMFNGILNDIKDTSVQKMSSIIKDIPSTCKMNYDSYENTHIKSLNSNRCHPIIPSRGEIYNAFITEGVGKELCGTHPVVIIQNKNTYADKVNVLPIEGDGNKINPKYQVQITSNDLEGTSTLRKNPSRIIISDVMTIDKARLGIKVGKLTSDKMRIIDEKLKIQLGL
jgi:mRNA-degrading endonuclease toxin of MazEF toxin-antitoxin module